jgi:hypothetical protein
MTPTYPEIYAQVKADIKQRVSRWPSAYASGQLVKKYKDLVSQTYGHSARPYVEDKTEKAPLSRWFREKWVDIATGKPCGSVKSREYYPTCRPLEKARQLTFSQRRAAIEIKQRAKNHVAKYPEFFK